MTAVKASKCVCDRGSAIVPARGAYSAPPDSLAGFGEGKERTVEGRGGKGLGMRSGEESKEGEREERKGKKGQKGRSSPSRTKILATALR